MRVLNADKVRDLFHWGINDRAVISPEIDQLIIDIVDKCSVEIKTEEDADENA